MNLQRRHDNSPRDEEVSRGSRIKGERRFFALKGARESRERKDDEGKLI